VCAFQNTTMSRRARREFNPDSGDGILRSLRRWIARRGA
jgi:hypothetical protein